MQEESKKFELDKIILAYALKDKKFTMELVNSVDSKYFCPEMQWIFDLVNKHFTDPKFRDIPSSNVANEYLRKNTSNEAIVQSSLKEFDDIKNLPADDSEFTWHLDKLRLRYNNKILKTVTSDAVKLIKTNPNDVDTVNKMFRDAIVGIDSIYRKQVYKEGSLDESAKQRVNTYKYTEEHPESARGILSGFKEFDRITNGLRAGELMIVAGETGGGKSIVMHNIGVNAYLGNNNPLNSASLADDVGHNILYFSLEMPKESIERRIDSCMGGLIYNQIRDGLLSKEDKEKYFKILEFQYKYKNKFYVVDMPKGVTSREIELKYLEVSQTKFKPDLIIIDYIGIMQPSAQGESDWLSMGIISAELHELARIYEIPIITGSQVNRSKEPFKQHYSTNRIARGEMITTNANIIVQIACRENEDTRTDMPVMIIKMRDGEKGYFVLSKDFAKMKVVDMMDADYSEDEDEDVGI